MTKILFYVRYAARNLWRSRRWSTFAVFSVAAGVATVVALRSLGLAIADSLTSNVRASNHGDITMEIGGGGGFMFRDPGDENTFTPDQLKRVQGWVTERGGQMTAYTLTSNVQIASSDYVSAGRPQFVTSLFIDPAGFPPTDDIRATNPAGAKLSDLLGAGNNVVVSENLASQQKIKVGDTVRVSGTEEAFTVRGIVSTSAQAGLRDIFSAFFGFAYFNDALKDKLPAPKSPNRISLILPEGTDLNQAVNDLSSNVIGTNGVYVRYTSVPQLLKQNQQIADVVGSFIVVMGLGALLIGGVGIVNTMLVVVQRRTEEIAALKTFGLKGRQVAALFMAEAVLLGFIGSLVGGFFGILLSGLANAYGQTLIQQPLIWKIYPEAVLFGLALGIIVTSVFGVMPVVIAVKVRPAIILRPNEAYIPRMGCLQSVGMMLIVVLVIGLIAGQILRPSFQVIPDRFAPNPLVVGIIGVGVTLLILGILVGLLWIVVWLVGKLPAFGVVDLRLALRNLTTHRLRTATTLLALSAGMFALSSISFFGAGTRQLLQISLSRVLGGNVIIFPVLPPAIAQPLVDSKLNSLEGVAYRTRVANYQGEITAVNDIAINKATGPSRQELQQQIREAMNAGDFEKATKLSAQMKASFQYNLSIISVDSTNPNPSAAESLLAGRYLKPEDKGQAVAVLRVNPTFISLGVTVGSTVSVSIDGKSQTLTIIGIIPDASGATSIRSGLMAGDLTVPPDALKGVSTQFQLTVAQIDSEHLNKALIELSALPLVYSFDISYVDNIMGRFIEQMSAIPILVGLLSLGAAAVIMANTVALATLERRRQIGILKAVGLKGRRVLSVMLLENTLVSALGGLIGIGLSALGVVIVSRLSLDISLLIPTDSTPVAIALVIAAVVIAWAATFLSARAVIGERVTNVLRYE